MPERIKLTIIGGGIIGLEMAVALKKNNIQSTVVELAPNILPSLLDSDMANLVEGWLTARQIQLITSKKVQQIKGSTTVNGVILDDGNEIPADLVVLSTGIKPNSALAFNSNLELGELGGIKTDNHQNVFRNGKPVKNIFALGDCVESQNLLTQQPMISALASTAIIQAQVIAKNITGTPKEVRGFVNPTVTMLAGL